MAARRLSAEAPARRANPPWRRPPNNSQPISTGRPFAKADELKKRIWFTLGALVIYRLGTYIPLPGIDPDGVSEASFLGQKQGVLDMFNMFSGGAVQRMAVFALNIMPYISRPPSSSSSLSSVVPSLEAIKKEGEAGAQGSQSVHALPDGHSCGLPGVWHFAIGLRRHVPASLVIPDFCFASQRL